MKTNTSLPITWALAATLMTGCSSTVKRDFQVEEVRTDVQHIVAPGERLSGIALKYTGKIDQWKEIAEFNGIADPRYLRIGDVLIIPAALIPDTGNPSRPDDKSLADKDSLDAASTSNAQTGLAATSGTLALQRSGTDGVEAVADVVVKPVEVNRTFDLKPINPANLPQNADNNTSPPRVQVIGSYYPKGVYQQPASYSTLMMRVAPGTVFEVEREVNDWYKIITDEGVGYLRMVDGKLLAEQ